MQKTQKINIPDFWVDFLKFLNKGKNVLQKAEQATWVKN